MIALALSFDFTIVFPTHCHVLLPCTRVHAMRDRLFIHPFIGRGLRLGMRVGLIVDEHDG